MTALAWLGRRRGRPSDDWQPREFFREELDREIDLQEKRADGTDTKAGILLVLVGIIVGVVKDTSDANGLQQAAQWVGAFGGLIIVASLFMSAAATLDAEALRDYYANDEEDTVRDVTFDTRAMLLDGNRVRLRRKSRLLRTALVVLGVAVALMIAGTVEKSGGHHGPTQTPKPTSTASATAGPSLGGQPHG
ncbi:hypothetical protein [Kitasatospora cineracea]|uniref:hypothetical protein n=1 Tax=Kitasatospora cineracea TaxID=88074 RepID=UPI000F495E72|nr:hypothetical protein [Kitasatospora cineracea]